MSKTTVRLAYALFFLMTLTSFGGPFLFGSILRGGASPDWPPDRPVEWVALAGTGGLVVALLLALTALGLVNMKEMTAAREAARRAKADRDGRGEA